ncbi:MAG TPA: peptide-methionine (S)-S-oxide reductase MsrA [Arenimonas sp.]|uniref:peptide-methionine (S)-S-oxide reductase MsrA n=1 Tax=Arenimonas sp. TaxID=1872635 RepID=UPI002C7030E5|nr:peptide-methionine (S)-S-oxide reductase MsrA [Arenimonas sp.]HMB56201.1 peptide-methionine (S)-S-oxide reductase MsrA [Arenimonas sp.]
MTTKTPSPLKTTLTLLIVSALAACGFASAGEGIALPNPKLDAPLAASKGEQTAVFAGGCFWGIEAVFEHVKGVKQASSGYAGGNAVSPDYETVSEGSSGHAESVKVQFDPAKISYGQLLKVYFSVAHDPTQLNRQGPDTGTQYRSAIFYGNEEQKRIANAYIAQLTTAKSFKAPIVTQVTPLKAFYPAEAYHQDYARLHPDNPYIVYNDAPKVAHLKQLLPELYKP